MKRQKSRTSENYAAIMTYAFKNMTQKPNRRLYSKYYRMGGGYKESKSAGKFPISEVYEFTLCGINVYR